MHHKSVPQLKIFVFCILIILILTLLTGCSGKPTWTPPPTSTRAPTATETPTLAATEAVLSENSVVTLPEGSIIIIKPGADVDIAKLPLTGLPETQKSDGVSILISKGEILVIPNPDSIDWLSVISTTGYVARVKGCGMIVNFNEVKDSFELQCIGAECEIGKDIDHMLSAANNKDWLYQGGIYFEPVDINFENIYTTYGRIIPDCVRTAEKNLVAPTNPAQSRTPSVTPDIAATGTAACVTFHNLFPATPCPTQVK